jgi:hypothetical protein
VTEPTTPRPVPGPYRPGPAPVAGAPTPVGAGAQAAPETDGEGRLDDLDELPVSEHVAVFEAEHARLQRELGTIDPR